jgi:hypothetical protein
MNVPQYDIFSGKVDEDAIWLEAVEGLGAANERMKEHAQRRPGPYFVFCQRTHAVLARIDTSVSSDAQRKRACAAGKQIGMKPPAKSSWFS